MNAPSFTNWSKSGSGRSLRFHQSADCGPRPDRWRAHGVSQTEVGDRHHRAPAHQHGPLRRRHRVDPVAGLRLGALCSACAAAIPIYRASQAAPCAEAGGQTPADLGPAQSRGRGFGFVRCGGAGAGAGSATDHAGPRPRSAELEQVPGAVNGGGESGAGRARPNARLGSGDHCRAFHRRPDPFHLRTPTGYRRAPPAVQVLLGPHPDAFLCLLLGGQSGAVRTARLHSGASSPGLASAPGTESWRLGIPSATALAQPGSGGGLLSPAVLFTHLGRVRPYPAGYHRSGPRQVARETQTDRALTVFSPGKCAASVVPTSPTTIISPSNSPPMLRWSGIHFPRVMPARQLSGPSIAMSLSRPRIRTHLTDARAFLPFSVSTAPPPPSLPRKAPHTV